MRTPSARPTAAPIVSTRTTLRHATIAIPSPKYPGRDSHRQFRRIDDEILPRECPLPECGPSFSLFRFPTVMPALVAAIHVFSRIYIEGVDGRDEPGHDSTDR